MFGWFSADTARVSCSKRRTRSASAANLAGRTLIATSRCSRESWAAFFLAHAAVADEGQLHPGVTQL